MKTSNISKIAAQTPNTKKAKFNLSHDNNTTYDWGSVQPLMSKLMLPDSSININMEQLTRLAPMVVPTFGRVKMKNIAHFVPCSEIFPNWDAMMSQTKVSRPSLSSNGQPTSSTYVPKNVPFINNNILAAFCLVGSKFNVYVSGTVGTDKEDIWTVYHNNGGTFNLFDPPAVETPIKSIRSFCEIVLGITNSNSPTTSLLTPWNYNGYTMSFYKLITDKSGARLLQSGSGSGISVIPTITTMYPQPLANANGNGFTHSCSNEDNDEGSVEHDSVAISFDGADIIWEYAGSDPTTGISSADRANGSGTPLDNLNRSMFDGKKVRIVFKLSSFGKRLRKILIGLGYDMNLANDDKVSLLPLFAFYKAYWDSYAPERTKNFYETYCWKLINATMANAGAADILTGLNDANGASLRTIFRAFMADLGNCFATEKIDAISAATDTYYNQTAQLLDINTEMKALIDTVLNNPKDGQANADGSYGIDIDSAIPNIYTNPTGGMLTQQLGQGVSSINLTQPQIDVLKKAYIIVNKNSVAGKKVEEILRALGFGDYVEECKGKFINASDDTIKISDVVATAATDDAKLGQYGGRGLGIGNFQFSYNTNRHGYMIILSTIVPESGYINAPVHENQAISFDTMYNPEFDGLAYEAIEKKNLAGSPLMNDTTYSQTFGFLPTYSQWKFMTNKANGDFSLNSMKTSIMPYTLDKYIPVSDANLVTTYEDSTAGATSYVCSPTFKYSDLPNAGEDYRYVNKFPWNGNYNRIFAAEDDGFEWSVYSPNNNQFLYNSFEYDNFLVHNVFNIAYFAHMKSIEDSYGTYDEEHGAPNTSVTRS